MKLESLKNSKFKKFEKSILNDTYNVKGGTTCDTAKVKDGPRTDYFDTKTTRSTIVATGEKVDVRNCSVKYSEIGTPT